MLTYKEAYDKIIQAYFNDEIQPMKMGFCFCGTLADKRCTWRGGDENYTKHEYGKMENALLFLFEFHDSEKQNVVCYAGRKSDKYEDYLFEGMCNAIEELKKIHLGRGENIDEVPTFTKRQLAHV